MYPYIQENQTLPDDCVIAPRDEDELATAADVCPLLDASLSVKA